MDELKTYNQLLIEVLTREFDYSYTSDKLQKYDHYRHTKPAMAPLTVCKLQRGIDELERRLQKLIKEESNCLIKKGDHYKSIVKKMDLIYFHIEEFITLQKTFLSEYMFLEDLEILSECVILEGWMFAGVINQPSDMAKETKKPLIEEGNEEVTITGTIH